MTRKHLREVVELYMLKTILDEGTIAKITEPIDGDLEKIPDDSDKKVNKYIEVKSYSQKRFASNCPYFYWSSNEAKVARKEKGNYYLYIVDRDNMNNVKYKPIIINNPYEEIFNLNKWIMEPQSWLFKKI